MGSRLQIEFQNKNTICSFKEEEIWSVNTVSDRKGIRKDHKVSTNSPLIYCGFLWVLQRICFPESLRDVCVWIREGHITDSCIMGYSFCLSNIS